MEGEFKHFGRQKTPEELKKQLIEVNTEKDERGLDVYYRDPGDFELSEKELKKKYGGQYEEYKNDLKLDKLVFRSPTTYSGESDVFYFEKIDGAPNEWGKVIPWDNCGE